MSGPLPDDPAPAEKLVPDPACKSCRGTGRYVVGYSGRDDDGNAPIWEDCDCFIPAGAVGTHQRQTPCSHCGAKQGEEHSITCPYGVAAGCPCDPTGSRGLSCPVPGTGGQPRCDADGVAPSALAQPSGGSDA